MRNNLSHESHQMQKAAACGRKSQVQIDSELAWLRKGPHIDGSLIIIPSPKFHSAAKEFWQGELGCLFSSHEKAWCFGWETAHNRPGCKKGNGNRYTAEQWLESISRKYQEFWASELAQKPEEAKVPAQVALIARETVGEYHPQHHTRGNWR